MSVRTLCTPALILHCGCYLRSCRSSLKSCISDCRAGLLHGALLLHHIHSRVMYGRFISLFLYYIHCSDADACMCTYCSTLLTVEHIFRNCSHYQTIGHKYYQYSDLSNILQLFIPPPKKIPDFIH